MKKIRSFALVVVSLVWDLWVGTTRRGEFYDTHSATAARTKAGYFLFIVLAGATAISIVSWAYLRLT